jgi:hypothetical protein
MATSCSTCRSTHASCRSSSSTILPTTQCLVIGWRISTALPAEPRPTSRTTCRADHAGVQRARGCRGCRARNGAGGAGGRRWAQPAQGAGGHVVMLVRHKVLDGVEKREAAALRRRRTVARRGAIARRSVIARRSGGGSGGGAGACGRVATRRHGAHDGGGGGRGVGGCGGRRDQEHGSDDHSGGVGIGVGVGVGVVRSGAAGRVAGVGALR